MTTHPLLVSFWIASLTAPGAPVDLDHGDLAELAAEMLWRWPAVAMA